MTASWIVLNSTGKREKHHTNDRTTIFIFQSYSLLRPALSLSLCLVHGRWAVWNCSTTRPFFSCCFVVVSICESYAAPKWKWKEEEEENHSLYTDHRTHLQTLDHHWMKPFFLRAWKINNDFLILALSSPSGNLFFLFEVYIHITYNKAVIIIRQVAIASTWLFFREKFTAQFKLASIYSNIILPEEPCCSFH